MRLEVKKRKVVSVNPSIMLLYGAPKVGKTTMLSQLDKCLIIDTEKGSHMVEGHIVEVNSREDLIEVLKKANGGHDFRYIALDTIDKIVDWAEKAVIAEHDVQALADLSFGKGYALVRDKVMNTIKAFKGICEGLILVGHRKPARAVVEGKPIVEPESLDITGKLKNMIMADCDAIGYVFRESESDKLKISFKSGEAGEAGSRCPHLKGEVVDFKWSTIYKPTKGG